MIGSGMSILCFIALRMVTKYASVEMAIEKGRKVIHDLCTHSNQRKATDYLQRTVMSAFLLRIIQKSNFFGRRTTESGKNSHVTDLIKFTIIMMLFFSSVSHSLSE